MRRGVFAACVLCAGCSAFLDTSGLTSNPPPPGSDGGTPPPQTIIIVQDGGVSDGGATPPPPGTSDWCEIHHPGISYCADFDNGPLPSEGVAGNVSLAPGSGVEQSGAAFMKSDENGWAVIQFSRIASFTKIGFAMSFQLDHVNDDKPFLRVAEIQIPDGQGNHFDLCVDVNGRVEITNQKNDANAVSMGLIDGTPSGWVELSLSLDTQTWQVVATLNNVHLVDDVMTMHPAAPPTSAGLIYGTVSGAPPATLLVDQVVFDLH